MVEAESKAADDTLFGVSSLEDDAEPEMPMGDCELVDAALLLEETVPETLVVVEEAVAAESGAVEDTRLELLIVEE